MQHEIWTDPDFGRRLTIGLATVIFGLLGLVLLSFAPGSIGWDYDIVLKEGALWSFRGHQPASAGIFAAALSFGTGSPFPVFLLKVCAYFAAALVIIFSRAHLLVRIAAVLLVCSPVFLYHVPLLRTNTIEASFLSLAIAVGMTGRSPWHASVAFLSLMIAAMHSQSVGPGHVGLVILYLAWQHSDWAFPKMLFRTFLAIVTLWMLVAAISMLAGSPSRSSTLYVSAVNSISGLQERGVETCLSQDLVRRSARTPDEIIRDRSNHPYVGSLFWSSGEGLRPPLFLSEAQREQVVSCWAQMIHADPQAFALERVETAWQSLSGGGLESHMVFVKDGPWLVRSADTVLGEPIEHSGFQKALFAYGKIGAALKIGTIRPYLIVFVVAGLFVWFRNRDKKLIVLAATMAVGGFMAPQLLLAQSIEFRYYLVAAHICAWGTLLFAWIILDETFGESAEGAAPK